MIDLTQIIVALIGLASAVITAFLAPLLRAKKAEAELITEDTAYVVLQELAKAAVHAAEQIYVGTGKGREKKAYVLQYLAERGFAVDETYVDIAIESAVLDMKQAMEG